MVEKKKRPRRRKVVKASDKKGGASATASSTVIVNVGGRRSRKPPTTLATFRPPSVAFTQPQMQPQFTSTNRPSVDVSVVGRPFETADLVDNVKTAVGEALKTALPKFYQIGEDMPTRYVEPKLTEPPTFTEQPVAEKRAPSPQPFPTYSEDATTEAGYMRPPQFVPEQPNIRRPVFEHITRLEELRQQSSPPARLTDRWPAVKVPDTQAKMQQQEAEAEATLTQPIRKPRAEPKVYDYSAITEDDISRVEIATQSNNPKKAEEKLKRAIRTYENSNKKQYMSARQALDEYLAKKESERQKK